MEYKKVKNDIHKDIIKYFVQFGNSVEKHGVSMLKNMIQLDIPCALYRYFWFDLLEPYLEVEIRQIFNPLFLTNCQIRNNWSKTTNSKSTTYSCTKRSQRQLKSLWQNNSTRWSTDFYWSQLSLLLIWHE